MSESVCCVVAWHNPVQRDKFCAAWNVGTIPDWLVFQRDEGWKSCARTKNLGVAESVKRGAEIVVVIDDDMFPTLGVRSLEQVMEAHLKALEPQSVELFVPVTHPISRGTPHMVANRSVRMKTAASMGWWMGIPDWDAMSQIVYGAQAKMEFKPQALYGRYAAISGMNLAFRTEFLPWASFIEVDRYDDVWMALLLMKEAYRRGYCINLGGPVLAHSRQSDPWANLRAEAKYAEENEVLWQTIATSPDTSYESLRKLLPV